MFDGKFALSMALLLLVAGCVSTQRPVKVSASDGLQINEFSADINDVFGKETVMLSLEVENVGGTISKFVSAKLFGGNSGWSGNDATAIKPLGAGTDNSLIPPLVETNKAGGFNRKLWSITAPDLPQGLTQNFDIGIRVRYDYTTTSVTPIDVISFDQFDQMRKKGTFEQGATATQNSNAPVKISLEAGSPITQQAAGASISETVILSFANVGSGVAFRDTATADDFPTQNSLGKVHFVITASKGTNTLQCDTGDGKLVSDGEVTLRRGFDTVKLPCTLTLDKNDLTAGVPKDTITATVTADYSYAIDSTASIKVTSKL
ncbi:MAG: hypothetical protein HY365_03425 [Candidatus Aenigmarchaeota archaeon]|nr:hypothetical protein [Candidatus Aenigmarchaeota archaeon]